MADDRVAHLLSVWQHRHATGEPVTPDDLCRDAPDLLPELRRRIDAIRFMERPADNTPGDHAEGEVAGTLSDGRLPVFGGYAVVRELGAGGMGKVVEAHDPKLGRRVAIKVMNPELAANPAARDRFLREARAAAAVRHDHIVPIYHVGEHDGEPFLVMPLLAGESLADRIDPKRDPLSPAEVSRIGRETALGLAAAHSAGLVHRDIKPGNLWLEAPNGRVLVLDFGLARSIDGADALTRPGSILGTPGYLAPEQANGLAVDPRADLFGLGATLYHAATGTRPFPGANLTAVLRAVAEHNPLSPHEVNPAIPLPLSNLIVQLLAKNPADRPCSAEAVVERLSGHAGTVELPAPPAPSEPPRGSRRWWLAAGVAAVILGVVWGTTWNGNRPEPAVNPAELHPPVAPPNAKPPDYGGSVEVYVYRKIDGGSEKALPLYDPRAMPLKPGDQLELEAKVEPPAFLYVFWIDETGTAVPAYPWRFGEWGTRPAVEEPIVKRNIRWPGGETLKIEGDNAGTETVLMLARPTKLEATDAEVKAWFVGVKAVPFQGEKAVEWFKNFDLVRDDPLRSPGKADPDEVGGMRGLQATLRQRIGDNANFSRAVSFSRLGNKGDK